MASARRLAESGVAPRCLSEAPLASALERRQRNISGGPPQRARTVPLGRLNKSCRETARMTRTSSLSCMADRSRTMVTRDSKMCAPAVMGCIRLVLRDININITPIPITSILMSILRGPPHQPGPFDHARGVHTLTRPAVCSPGVGETMVNSGLARDDLQRRSTRSIRSTHSTRPTRQGTDNVLRS